MPNRKRVYNLFGKGYSYAQVPTNRERFTSFLALIGSIGLSLGAQHGHQFAFILEARANEPVAREQVQPVSTENVNPDNDSEGAANNAMLDRSKPTTAPLELTEKEQIIAYIVEVFGEHAPEAFNVLFCENRNLDPKAVNYNRNGTVDRGIFQLNSAYWGGEENFDWKTNIDKAYMIFERAGKKFTPWTCSHRVGQKNYLGQ